MLGESYQINLIIRHIFNFPSPVQASTVEQDIRRNSVLPNARKRPAEFLRRTDITGVCREFSATFCHVGFQGLNLGVVGEVDGDNISAGFGEGNCHSLPETACSTCCDGSFAMEGEELGNWWMRH